MFNIISARLAEALASLLEISREEHWDAESESRKHARRTRLKGLIHRISTSSPLQFKVKHPSMPEEPVTCVIPLHMPLPYFERSLEWPIVRSLLETDTTVEEMEANLEEHRVEIHTLIVEWRNRVLAHFADQLRDGSEAQGIILQPTLIVSDGDSDPFGNFSDDLKLLMRADSLFYDAFSVARGLPKQPLAFGTMDFVQGLGGSFSEASTRSNRDPNLDRFQFYPEAREVARALLADLGTPDMSCIEVKSVGEYHICMRCPMGTPRNWYELVQHFIDEQRLYESIRKSVTSSSDPRIIYNNVHDPAWHTDLPMVVYYTLEVNGEIDDLFNADYSCKLCNKLPIIREVAGPKPAILRHLLEVHGVVEPKVDEHFSQRKSYMPLR